MKNQIAADVHSLSVVWNVTYDRSSTTGKPTIKESWLKVRIEGAEGSVQTKLALLAESNLQFKIGTSSRINDAKATDAYYPRGLECAQLFTILGNVARHVDMTGFDATKWLNRFPSSSSAYERLSDYIEETAEQVSPSPVVPEIASPIPDQVAIPVDTNNRMSTEEIPVVAPIQVKGKGRARKLV